MRAIPSTESNMTIVFLCLTAMCFGQAFSFSSDDSSADNVAASKDNLRMLRLERGLHMLRLGRRSLGSEGDSKKVYSLQALLKALISQPRYDQRRQPPVPRYGRNLEGMEKPEDVYFPEVFRPAPRGGRYRRANLASLPKVYLENEREVPMSVRTVVRPRIGRYLEALTPPEASGPEDTESLNRESRSDVLTL